uniref:Uncharacterized protein n=1 Tax=Opuntia streptacantha TaxID=393608 RepID=A0A7C8ZK42_OPUST
MKVTKWVELSSSIIADWCFWMKLRVLFYVKSSSIEKMETTFDLVCFFGWLKQFNHSHPPSTNFNQLHPFTTPYLPLKETDSTEKLSLKQSSILSHYSSIKAVHSLSKNFELFSVSFSTTSQIKIYGP